MARVAAQSGEAGGSSRAVGSVARSRDPPSRPWTPRPRRELEVASARPVGHDADELREVGLGLEVVELGGGDQREDVRRCGNVVVGSDDGAEANTVFVSLLASCRIHKVVPWTYLRDVLCLLSVGWPVHRILELAPLSWSKTIADGDVQRLLAANPYRALTLLAQ